MCLESISGNPPKVIQHFCSCKAGQGACNHKVALLYQAAHYSMLNLKTVPVIPSKTSVPQEWHKPRTAGVSTECSQDIHVRKPKFKSNIGGKRSFDGVKSSLYNPITSDFPPKKFIEDFQSEMISNFPDTQFSKLFSSSATYTKSHFGLVPHGSILSYQQKLATDYSHVIKIPNAEIFLSFRQTTVHRLTAQHSRERNHYTSKGNKSHWRSLTKLRRKHVINQIILFGMK